LEALIRPEAEQKKKPGKAPAATKPGVTEIPLKEIVRTQTSPAGTLMNQPWKN